jgi:carbonic anhydrase
MDRTALEAHRRKTEKDAHEGHRHFEKESPSDYDARSLRRKHVASLLSDKAPRLTTQESRALLLAGNAEHVAALDGAPMTPLQRYSKIHSGEADYLVVACSDARILRLDSEKDPLVGLFIRIAGNVVPEKGSSSFDEMRDAVQMVRKDGAVIIEGHDGGPGCGAVNERVKWIEAGMPHTGSEPLDALLHRVVGDNPAHNAIAQLTTARNILDLGERPSAALVYDWEHAKHRHAEPVHIVSANHSDVVEILKDSWNRRHAEAAGKADLVPLLRNQRPHAIAVGTNDLPFSVATIFHAEQNEVFSTTGSEHGLDELDMASILYAVEHLHVHHIPFVAPGREKDGRRVSGMFDRWEKQLRGMEVHGAPIIARMLDSGELRISRFRYDLDSGVVEELPGGSIRKAEAAQVS